MQGRYSFSKSLLVLAESVKEDWVVKDKMTKGLEVDRFTSDFVCFDGNSGESLVTQVIPQDT